jgi:Phage integrase, N-terminal SAM-like domain
VPRLRATRTGDRRAAHAGRTRTRVRAAASEQDAAIYLTAAFTGLRRGELLALHWRDIDFTGSVIRVRGSFAAGALTTPKSGPDAAEAGATFADAVAEYLRYAEHDRGCKPSTLQGYCSAIGAHLLPAFGELPIESLGTYSGHFFGSALSRQNENPLLAGLFHGPSGNRTRNLGLKRLSTRGQAPRIRAAQCS